MTEKKSIMINNVDVSKCIYFGSQNNCIINSHKRCDNFHNCYFKQLERKTQECEKLKNNFNIEHAELLNARSALEVYKTCYRAKHDDIKNYLGRLEAKNKWLEKKLIQIKEIIGDSLIYKETDYGLDNITRELIQIIDKVE